MSFEFLALEVEDTWHILKADGGLKPQKFEIPYLSDFFT